MRKSALPGLLVLVSLGCAPALRMTVEHRDAVGTLVRRSTVSNTDTGPLSFTVGVNDTISATADAEFKNGLTRLWIEADYTCRSQGSGAATIQNGGFLIPSPSGNAIPSNQTPSRFSFTDSIRIVSVCNQQEMRLNLRAGATTVATSAGGPATSWTQSAVIQKP